MKLKKTLAALAVITAGSATMAFGQALNAQADDITPTDEYIASVEAVSVADLTVGESPIPSGNYAEYVVDETSAPVEEVAAPVEEIAAPVEEIAAPVEETAAPVEETAAPVEEIVKPIEETTTPAEKVVEASADAVYEGIKIETEAVVNADVAPEITSAAVAEEKTETAAAPLDRSIHDAVDISSDAGKAQIEDKTIDYDKIYNDFVNNEIIPKTDGGLASLTPAATAQETVKGSNGVRVYSELLGVVAATVYDFCQDGIPELITVTHQRLDNGSMAPQSRFIYDLYQYNKATDTIGLLTSTEDFKMDENYLITPQMAQGGGGEFTLSITGNSLLKDEWVYGKYASDGPFATSHDYSVYNLDNYKFSKYKVTIGKDRVSQTLPEDYKLGGSTDFELLYYDKAKDPGWGVYNDSPKYSSLNAAAAEITANMKKYGVDMAGVSFGTKEVDFYSSNKEQLDMNIDGLKVEKPIMDYYMSYKNRGDIRMNDYTGLHGTASAGTEGKTGNESTKAANKYDSPKTGVAFPISAAGTGAAALALAAVAFVLKKKN